jgi:hypothetical protein
MTGLEVVVLLINYQIKIHADIRYKFIVSKTKLITQKQKQNNNNNPQTQANKEKTIQRIYIYIYIYEGKERKAMNHEDGL